MSPTRTGKWGLSFQLADAHRDGIDPGSPIRAGVIEQCGPHLACVAYGCVATPASRPLAERLAKIHHQIGAVVERFRPECVGIETVWFGQNVTAAFATGQARGRRSWPAPRAALPWVSIHPAR